MVPGVIFKAMSLDDDIELVKWALKSSNSTLDLHDSIIYNSYKSIEVKIKEGFDYICSNMDEEV